MYHIFNWLHNFPVCNKSGLLISTIMKIVAKSTGLFHGGIVKSVRKFPSLPQLVQAQ
jgi:hypothetical protein